MSLKDEGNWTHACTEGRLRRNIQREAVHVKMTAEIGVILPQARDTWGYEELEVKEESFCKSLGTVWPCQHFDLGLLTSRTVRQPPQLVLLYGSPRKPMHYTKEYRFEYNGSTHLYGMGITEELIAKTRE